MPLAPVLMAQALWVRVRAMPLPEAAGPRGGRAGQGPLLRLLILGDSSGAGVGVRTQEQALSGQIVSRLAQDFTVDWRLDATTGHTTADVLAQLDRIEGPFDMVVTALGVNDVTMGRTRRRFMAERSALLAELTGRLGARCVVVNAVPPLEKFPALPHPLAWVLGRQAARLDDGLREVVAEVPQAHLIPMHFPDIPGLAAADGYHPSALLYQLWAERAVEVIRAQARARI